MTKDEKEKIYLQVYNKATKTDKQLLEPMILKFTNTVA